MSKNWRWKGTGPSQDQKSAFADNLGKCICNKMEKSSKTGQEKKSLGAFFVYFLTAIAKSNF